MLSCFQTFERSSRVTIEYPAISTVSLKRGCSRYAVISLFCWLRGTRNAVSRDFQLNFP